MAGVEAAGSRLFVTASETGEALVLNTVLFKSTEETAEQTQRRVLFQRVYTSQSGEERAEPTQRHALFQTVCVSEGQRWTLVIDSGSTNNLVAKKMVEKLGLRRQTHPTPYRVSWLQDGHQLTVDEQCKVEFHIENYKDKVTCDIISMDACHIILGRPWQYHRNVVHFGRENHYMVRKNGIPHVLVPIKDEDKAGTSEARSQFLKQVEKPKEKVKFLKQVENPKEKTATVEKSAEESTVTPPASEPEAESEQVEKPKEESAPAAKEAEPAKAVWGQADSYALTPILTSKSEPPPLFDGTTRLYISVTCPYAQRVWSARNIKGLSQIQLVPIDLQDRPAWYKEKVYPPNKDPAKKEAANELLKYTDTFTKNAFIALTKPDSETAQEAGPALDYLENALGKFSDGPFFLGQFSVVDIAYGPFVERFHVAFPALKNYDITAGRPKLSKWIQELHKIEGYAKTVSDPESIVETYKRILANHAK